MPDAFDDRVRRLADDLSSVPLPTARAVRRAALHRRRARVSAAAAVAIVGVGTTAAIALGSGGHHSIRVVTTAPSTRSSRTAVTAPPPYATPARTSVPATTAGTTAPTTATTPSRSLPISVESDSQMKAEGNNGPSSSILLPASCRMTGSTVTAAGTYTNGGFVPNVYNRYGDIVVLYVFAPPSAGYPQGAQLGASGVRESPPVGTPAPWHVSVRLAPSLGRAARCEVAAQPTHNLQLAP